MNININLFLICLLKMLMINLCKLVKGLLCLLDFLFMWLFLHCLYVFFYTYIVDICLYVAQPPAEGPGLKIKIKLGGVSSSSPSMMSENKAAAEPTVKQETDSPSQRPELKL